MSSASDSLLHDLDAALGHDFFDLFLNEEAIGPPSNREFTESDLYEERLQSLIDSQVRDIESFALREGKDIAQVRRFVAATHARNVFSREAELSAAASTDKTTPTPLLNLLRYISSTLEKLNSTFSIDSLLLVVSPTDASDGWLGGSPLGREFWRSLKGGGVSGARAFKIKSQEAYQTEQPDFQRPTASTRRQPASQSIKSHLNSMVRETLREASGIRTAEMKWTKPSSLESNYGVKLVGWPNGVAMQNPSYNSVDTNRLLLEGFSEGRIRFVKAAPDLQ